MRWSVYLLVALSLLLGGLWGWLYWGWKQEQPIIARMNQLGGKVQCQPMGPKWLRALMPQEREWVLDRADAVIGSLDEATDEDLAKISTLSRLRQLRLMFPKLTEKGWEAVGRMASLEGLRAIAPRAGDRDLAKLSRLGKLRMLSIECPNATDECFVSLRGLSSLEELDVGSVQIRGAGLRELVSMPRLRLLRLHGTFPSAESLSALAGASVEELELQDSELSDAHLQVLRSLPRLRKLSLRFWDKVTPGCAEHLRVCETLREVTVWDPDLQQALAKALPDVKVTGP